MRDLDDLPSLEDFGRQLDRVAALEPVDGGSRRAAAPRWRRTRRGRPILTAVLVLGVSGGAAAWAATALLSNGAPVAYQRGAPIAGRAQGAPVPGTVKLLVDDVADPAGGPPWGLRSWKTDRKYGCLQVGRVYEGRLGQITGGKVFHELRLGITRDALGGCYVLDGSDQGFVALHTDAGSSGQPPACPIAVPRGTTLRGPGGTSITCRVPERTVDFGLLGPNARTYTFRAGGRIHTARPLGGPGAYLVVQPRIKPVIREYGFHHRDPALNLRGPAEPYIGLTPGSQVIKTITYADSTCRVRITSAIMGSCADQAGFVPIPQPRVGDLRTTVRAFAAPDGRGIRVRFRAGAPVVDGRSGYTIEVRPSSTHAFATQTYSRNIAAGRTVRITVDLYDKRRGAYRIVVRYRSVRPRPGPLASLAYPGTLVGQTRVVVP